MSISQDTAALERIATELLTPTRRSLPASPVAWDERREFDGPSGPLVSWSAGRGPSVMLVHGWEGSHADLDAFVEPLLARGLGVVTLDLPAHGESGGTTASIVDFAAAIAALAARTGPLRGVVAHSAGCPATALALERGLAAERVALIATPESYLNYVRWCAAQANVDAEALIAVMRARGLDVGTLVLPETAKRLSVPALFVHSLDDKTCDVRGAERVAAAWRGSEFVRVDGLGHNRILRDPAVTGRVVDHLLAR